VGRATGIARNRLYSLTRDREGAHGRSMVAYLSRVVSGHMVMDVAQHFQRSPMRISQAIIQLENKISKDKHLMETIVRLKEDLTKKGKKKYFIQHLPAGYSARPASPRPCSAKRGRQSEAGGKVLDLLRLPFKWVPPFFQVLSSPLTPACRRQGGGLRWGWTQK